MFRVLLLLALASASYAFVMTPVAVRAPLSRATPLVMEKKDDFLAPLSNVPAEAVWLNAAGVGLVATGAGISATGSPAGGLCAVTVAVLLMKLGAMKLEEGNGN